MKNVKEFQYKTLVETADPYTYNGELYVMPTDLSKNLVTSPVNRLTGDNVTPVTDVSVIENTLSGESGQIPFSVSFKVHSDLWTSQGNKSILNLNGIIAIKVADSKVLIKLPTVYAGWYAIPNNELVTGWNTIEYSGDGTHIYLKINGVKRTLFTATGITQTWYSNFNNSNYIFLPKNLRSNNNSVWHFGFKTGSNMTSKQAIIHSEGFLALEFSSTTLCAWSFSNGTQNLFNIAANTEYWLKVTFNGSTRTVELSTDGGETFPQSKSFTDTTDFSRNNYDAYLGCSSYSVGNDSFKGELEMLNFTITTDGVKTFDGATAVAGVDYTVIGSPTITQDGILYPEITAGSLTTSQSILYLKDIQAIKL